MFQILSLLGPLSVDALNMIIFFYNYNIFLLYFQDFIRNVLKCQNLVTFHLEIKSKNTHLRVNLHLF